MAEALSAPAELDHAAPQMIEQAVAVTARRMHLPTPLSAFARLEANDPTAVSYFRYELARQVALLLLRYDRNVVALYEEQELAPPEASLYDALRVYVLVEQDTRALDHLLEALDRALVTAIAQRFGQPPSRYLHAVVVDRARANLLRPRAHGHRPRPALVLARESIAEMSD